jgi:hypothetical protein
LVIGARLARSRFFWYAELMSTNSRTVLGSVSALALLAVHCGGSAPAASGPKPTPAAAVQNESLAANSSKAATDTNAAPAAGASTEATGEKPTRPPHEILQLKDTLFKLNFEESERGQTAAAGCDQKSGGIPKKRSACMSQARDAIDVPDGYQIQHVGDDWVWKTVRLRGNHLITLSHTVFEFGEETENSIAVKFQSKPNKNLPAELKVSVPSDYVIVLTDPRYGRLVYEAKVGIAGGD